MEKLIEEELMKELNWKEKIMLRILKKYTNKIYKLGITYGFNSK